MLLTAHFIKRRRVLCIAFCVLCIVAFGFIVRSQIFVPDVVVTRTTNGFAPQKVLIKKGQAIIFKTDSGKEFWPASDFHPTHGLYPEFDPTRPIPHDGSWRFVFAKAGVWTYHDHLSPDVHGTIIVVGAPGESTRVCLSKTASTSVQSTCWEGDITEALQSKGLKAAFDTFRSFYANDPSFRGLNCHDATHILGAAAYKAYADNHTIVDRLETSYCGYGFYHGFMEAMLLDKGPGQYQKVRAYCDSLKTNRMLNNPSGACYHGIGHAAFDSIQGGMWGDDAAMVKEALGVCERAALGEAEQAQCGTGVFNALAIAESAKSYKLSFGYPDPMRVCRVQEKKYQEGCFGEVGIGVIREDKLDRTASIQFIKSFNDSGAEAAILLGYAGDEVKRSIAAINLPDLHTLCASFASQKNQEACMRGGVAGMREGGEPGKEYKLMFRFCGLYAPGALRKECYSFSISQARSIAADAADFQKACMRLDEADVRALCK